MQPQPAIYIDCKLEAVNTPDSFASTLLSTSCSDRLQLDETVTHNHGAAIGLIGSIESRSSSTPIAIVLHILRQALKQTLQKGRTPPPIIIDEANKLTSWRLKRRARGCGGNARPRKLRRSG